ncbi:MAG: peptidoglycan DD-metalloendopeptidase family protein [Pseudomonadota bacterium]|nr:peptidoglycan DD-metalloendopeptidase family protein [Pseudomonadota bacterium]
MPAALAGCASTHSPAPIRERAQTASDKAAASKPPPPVAAGHYRVLPGDTLFKIAFEFGQDTADLAIWNNLADPGRIRSGEILRVIPPRPQVATRALPATPTVETRVLAKPTPSPVAGPPAPTVPMPAGVTEDASPDIWSWPIRGPLLARFGDGLSKGIDIAGPRGLPVQAAASGRVVYAGSGLRGYGKLIIIRHGKTLLSAYAHNARILVSEGQSVARGQAVGEIGDSDTDRVKLHFEIRERGKPVNPLIYLPNAG